MKEDISRLLAALVQGQIIQAPALPFKVPGFYADLVLITSVGNVRIIGESFDLPTGEETFYFTLVGFEPERYWLDKQGQPAWPPREGVDWSASDLVPNLKSRNLQATLAATRKVKFYRTATIPLAVLPPKGDLQSAAAIVLEGTEPPTGQFLIYATPRFPCSLEITWEELRINSILAEMEEFDLVQM